MEWWINNIGENMLESGRLADDVVIDFLIRIPEAEQSCRRLLPHMNPIEQQRLGLMLRHVKVASQVVDQKQLNDAVQSKANKQGIRVWTTQGWK